MAATLGSSITPTQRRTGEHLAGARRLLLAAIVVLCGSFLQAADPENEPQVTVVEQDGVYVVRARFEVPQPPAVALAVLTDYEEIPRFMPQIKTSVILESGNGRTVVEQEAVSRLMAFSKRVHLVLEIDKTDGVLRFRDLCGRSFKSYEGSWRVSADSGRTAILYELIASPSFDIPEFLLKRVLKRDSVQTIAQLRREMASRSPR